MFAERLRELFWDKRSLLFAAHIYLLFLGFYSYVIFETRNDCEMTFMFQFPEFISIPLKRNVTKKFPNYSLFVYGEGSYAMSWQYPKMTNALSGVPVLFVPGNGGSYKQVRSFGSIALRMAEDLLIPFNFDFFTINFDEELSGLSGDLLEDQTEFLYESIEAIKNLYFKAGRNVSLIVIGHSVGGLISRAVFLSTNFEPSSVDMIITLATPHQRSVLPIDMSSTKFYQKVNDGWNRIRGEPKMAHLTIVSINGGFHDKLVMSELTRLENTIDANGDVSLSTSMIPDVWLSTDHLCIVWCRQLITKLLRLMFDLIPKDETEITKNMELRRSIIRYHMFTRSRSKTYPSYIIPQKLIIPAVGDYIHEIYRFTTFQKQKVIATTFILIPLVQKTTISIMATGLQKLDWVVACTAKVNEVNSTKTKSCNEGTNLSQYSQVIPGDYELERRFYKQDASHLLNKGYDHILLYVAPTTNRVTIYGERYPVGRRNKAIVLPSLFQSLTSMIFSAVTVLNIPITEESTFYNLTLVGIEQIWHSYWAKLEVVSCYPTASETIYMHFSVPWNNEDTFTTVRPRKKLFAETVMKVNAPKPNPSDRRHPHLYLILDPYCGYDLKLKLSLPEILGEIFRHYYPKLLPLINAILLSVIAFQMKPQRFNVPTIAQSEQLNVASESERVLFLSVPIILKRHFISVSIYGFLPLTSLLLAKLIQQLNILTQYTSSFVESHLTFTQNLMLQVFLYLTSYSIIYLISTIVTLIICIFNELLFIVYNTFFADLRSKTSLQSKIVSKFNLVTKFPIIISLIVCGISVASCSAIGLLVAIFSHFIQTLIYSFKCFRLERRCGKTPESTNCHIHLTVLFVLLASFLPTIPFGFIWIRNHLEYDFTFSPQLSDFHIPLLILLLSSFWQQTSVIHNNKYSANVSTFLLKLLSIFASIFGVYNYSFISIVNAFALLVYNLFHILCVFKRIKPTKVD